MFYDMALALGELPSCGTYINKARRISLQLQRAEEQRADQQDEHRDVDVLEESHQRVEPERPRRRERGDALEHRHQPGVADERAEPREAAAGGEGERHVAVEGLAEREAGEDADRAEEEVVRERLAFSHAAFEALKWIATFDALNASKKSSSPSAIWHASDRIARAAGAAARSSSERIPSFALSGCADFKAHRRKKNLAHHAGACSLDVRARLGAGGSPEIVANFYRML